MIHWGLMGGPGVGRTGDEGVGQDGEVACGRRAFDPRGEEPLRAFSRTERERGVT